MNLLVKRARSGDKEAFVQLMEESKLSCWRRPVAILKDEEGRSGRHAETVLTAFQSCAPCGRKIFQNLADTHSYQSLLYHSAAQKTVLPATFCPRKAKRTTGTIYWTYAMALEETSAGEDRLVLTLFYVEDMSQRETGRVLGISENAVKQRLARGRSHFKSIYCKEAVNS